MGGERGCGLGDVKGVGGAWFGWGFKNGVEWGMRGVRLFFLMETKPRLGEGY